MKSMFFAISFAAGALVVTVAVEAAIIATMHSFGSRPIGLGWVVMPITATVGGWQMGRRFEPRDLLMQVRARLDALNREERLSIGYSALWIVGWSLFCAIFDPFGQPGWSWHAGQWMEYLFGCFGPIVAAFAVQKVRVWSGSA